MSEIIDSASFSKILEWYADPVQFWRDIFFEEPYQYQSDFLIDLVKDPNIRRVMICAASSTGKTKLLAVFALWSAAIQSIVENRRIEVIVISGSEEQSRGLYQYCFEAIKDNKILQDITDEKPLKTLTKFKNKSEIRALPKSFKSIYGKHGEVTIVDEACLAGGFVIQDALRILAKFPQSRLILSSTPYESAELFVDMWEDKKEYPEYNPKKPSIFQWKRFSWSALDCDGITADAIKEAKKHLSTAAFQVYWLGEPYPLIGTLIPIEKVKLASRGNPTFQLNENYDNPIMGIDWGFFPNPTAVVIGQKIEDIWHILFCKTWLKIDPEAVAKEIEFLAKKYHVKRIVVDSVNKSENFRLINKGLPVTQVAFRKEKELMQSNLVKVFEKDQIKIPEGPDNFIKLNQQLKKYQFDTKTDEDLVDALMLLLRPLSSEGSGKLYYKILKIEESPHSYLTS